MAVKYWDINQRVLEPKKFYTLASDNDNTKVYFTDKKGVPKDVSGGVPDTRAGFMILPDPEGHASDLEQKSAQMETTSNFIKDKLLLNNQVLQGGRGNKPRHQRSSFFE